MVTTTVHSETENSVFVRSFISLELLKTKLLPRAAARYGLLQTTTGLLAAQQLLWGSIPGYGSTLGNYPTTTSRLLLFFFYTRLGGLGRCNDLICLQRRNKVVMIELHRERCPTLGHGG